MRRPKHTTAKARTKSAAGRIWARHWLEGPDGQAMFRSMMDRVQERVLGDYFGCNVEIAQGKLARVTWANGATSEFA